MSRSNHGNVTAFYSTGCERRNVSKIRSSRGRIIRLVHRLSYLLLCNKMITVKLFMSYLGILAQLSPNRETVSEHVAYL